MRLIRRDGPQPPGGYPFTDPRTGFKFDGFAAGGFGEQVLKIVWHRVSNPKVYPPNSAELVPENIAKELDAYQCQRLGNDKRWCVDGEKPAATVAKAAVVAPVYTGGKCPTCGGNLVEKLCGSCSGRRVVGYQCQACGVQIKK